MRFASFLDSAAGRIFCTGFLPERDGGQQRRILILPPFAEEMNKSRHVLAAIAKQLANAGHAVLMPDLYGTGDSEGDFGDAAIELWRRDIDVAIEHLPGTGDVDLVGLRLGALLAVDAASRHKVRSLTLIHPVLDGRQQLTQMLRLRLAAGLMGGGEKETAAELKQRLSTGESLEIAGYRLSPTLAAGLEALALTEDPPAVVEALHWIECVAEEGRTLMPASQRVLDTWEALGTGAEASTVTCDAFWGTQEIARCPALVNHVARCLAV